ncbi:hypothetical protein H0A36_22365 [Endozoicomonas sp. SM1973]|uniref:Uncharacterized protein n=1 Tax=Spartinivicinus marinus TaxID=2994442 RepID=A0A853II28_9GAMM|nr:hypothetical protein [Spartinivicinus marinus]MCX4029085.1 hypothetical protein [Spartinivicinus marinus]NYZ68765.1 hypothetical protein [Spartinivicinus marinus]
MKLTNGLVLFFLLISSYAALAQPDWADTPYLFKSNDRSIKQALLDFSFNMDTPLELPEDNLNGVKPIDLPEMTALEYLNYLCRLARATWYFDGYKLYIIKQDDIKNEILSIENISYRKLVSLLKELEVYDSKFTIKHHPLESVIYIRGPDIYIKSINKIVKKYRQKEKNKINIVYGNN